MAKARKPEKYPTEGGSYVRKPDGKIEPAPPPVPSEAEEPPPPAPDLTQE